MLLFSMAHRKLGEITKAFVTAFCKSCNKCFPDYGRDQIEFATAEFLNPFSNGSGLTLDQVKFSAWDANTLTDPISPTKTVVKKEIDYYFQRVRKPTTEDQVLNYS